MESSMRFGIMTVFAVSGSMVLLIHQVHKHMLKNFMEKFECEICGYPNNGHKTLDESMKEHHKKKKVRFSEHVLEFPPIENKQHITKKDEKVLFGERVQKWRCEELKDVMPYNMYRGILKHRN
ncbi:hypothetical protein PIB30_011915 [Stylosanthes scabra]|uniref:Uncharacterized protein n=1 Tax=Stylosanthes scabra TaxID=79078 RepID=A0ABU6V4A6_9FABA|nr:hypothetical protein [Stylosanthes scabra]